MLSFSTAIQSADLQDSQKGEADKESAEYEINLQPSFGGKFNVLKKILFYSFYIN